MTTDPLLARLRQLSWPAPVVDHPDPAPGQLWRAVWSDIVSLVVVLAAPSSHRKVAVAAASADDAGDDHSVAAETTSGLRPTVWAGVTAEIPVFTLDRRLGDLTPTSFEQVTTLADGRGRGDWAPAGDLDDRALMRADGSDRLAGLGGAEWLPAAPSDDRPSFAEAARAARVTASAVAARLGIAPGDARRLLQGRREATSREKELLEGLFGPTSSGGVSYDPDLVVALDHPEFRPALRLIAISDHGGDEAAARRAMAGQMMAMAARHRGAGARNWKALLRDALRQD